MMVYADSTLNALVFHLDVPMSQIIGKLPTEKPPLARKRQIKWWIFAGLMSVKCYYSLKGRYFQALFISTFTMPN